MRERGSCQTGDTLQRGWSASLPPASLVLRRRPRPSMELVAGNDYICSERCRGTLRTWKLLLLSGFVFPRPVPRRSRAATERGGSYAAEEGRWMRVRTRMTIRMGRMLRRMIRRGRMRRGRRRKGRMRGGSGW
eukprot:2269192-Pyramimonas_sp.AAC.1